MAAVVDNRYGASNVNSYPMSQMNSSPLPMTNQTVVQDTYGGWMTRSRRALVFGLFAMSWVLGAFLPGVIMLGMNWSSDAAGGIRGACTNSVATRALITCCFFIGHALLVCPMFIKGDKAHSVTTHNQNGSALRSFWTTRLAHTAAVLQVVGNLIELALLAWTASAFWESGGVGRTDVNACRSSYPEFQRYMWAMLIIGFVTAALSLATIHKQYTSAALRFGAATKGNGPVLASAP